MSVQLYVFMLPEVTDYSIILEINKYFRIINNPIKHTLRFVRDHDYPCSKLKYNLRHNYYYFKESSINAWYKNECIRKLIKRFKLFNIRKTREERRDFIIKLHRIERKYLISEKCDDESTRFGRLYEEPIIEEIPLVDSDDEYLF